jgi:transposase InsO family protein
VTRIVETLAPRVGVEPVLRELGVPSSTYYARRTRTPSARARRDAELLVEIAAAREGYRRVYGQRKTWRELRRRGIDVGRDRVARLMREAGLEGVRRGRRPRTTTPAEREAERARDLVQRQFVADAPNQLWVADITYLRTYGGFVYLAFILDVYSRMIVGWQLASHLRSELATDALEMAAALRQPAGQGLIFHSDRGSQYTSVAYTDRLDELNIAPSVGSKGDAYDNAMAEAFVATLKAELIQGRTLPSFEHTEHQLVPWIGFYNHHRLHEELGDVPPAEFEAAALTAPAGPPRPAVQLHEGAPSGLGTAPTETTLKTS